MVAPIVLFREDGPAAVTPGALCSALSLERRPVELSLQPAQLRPVRKHAAGQPTLPTHARPFVLPSRVERGVDVLHDPVFNKGTAFPLRERDRLGLRGLLPPRMLDIEQQATKCYDHVKRLGTPLEKWLALQALQDRNETLFYRPTIGEVCLQYSRMYRRARGMYFSADDIGDMHAIAYNWPSDRVDVIVLTDGSRILGLGDLGVQGMGIPVGKLDLYVAGAGIHPGFVLPVCLDVGTNNEALRNDDTYLGLVRPRLTGDAYYAAVDELVSALRGRWPTALLQFEDFSGDHAAVLLDRYRDGSPTFNDDIQGTAAVVLAGVYGALAAQFKAPSAIVEERFLVAGAGSAGMGIAQCLTAAMVRHGLSRDDALRQFCVLDQDGVVGTERAITELLRAAAPYARDDITDGAPLAAAVEAFRPTALLGLSTVGGLFTPALLARMGELNERPLVFALSNPTSRSECTCAQAAAATGGRAIFASGSPFEDAPADGATGRVVVANQGIFPGVGLGCVLSGAPAVTDDMLCAAAEALPRMLTPEALARGAIYPRVADIRKVSSHVAAAVIRAAAASPGGCRCEAACELLAHGATDDDLADWAEAQMYVPQYAPLVLGTRH